MMPTKPKYHICKDRSSGRWVGGCAWPLKNESVVDAVFVPIGMRCQMQGCRQRWPKVTGRSLFYAAVNDGKRA